MPNMDYATLLHTYTKEWLKPDPLGYDKLDVGLWDVMKGLATISEFRGDSIKQTMRTSRPFTAQSMVETTNIPEGDKWTYARHELELTQFVVNTALTKMAIDRASGGDDSLGNIIEEALNLLVDDRNWLMKLGSMGDGSGRLARLKTCTESSDTFTCTCDNTYSEFGWDNVGLMTNGMKVDIYNGANPVANCTGLEIFDVRPGKRVSDDGYAAHDGTFKFVSTADLAVLTGSSGTACDNFTVHIAGSYGTMMTGLTGILGTSEWAPGKCATTFQGVNRTTGQYAFMMPLYFEAADFGTGSPSDGTPTNWDATVVSDVLLDLHRGASRPEYRDYAILCSSKIAATLYKLGVDTAGGMQITVNNTGQLLQPVVGLRFAQNFTAPDGTQVPIIIDDTMSDHVMFFLHKPSMDLYMNNWGFLNDYGTGEWQPVRASRQAAYEAPYHGYVQCGVKRADTFGVLSDLRFDL